MLSVIILVYLLLPALAAGSTVQQDLLCTDSYAEFESASVGSNISGANLRSQLYEVFFAPNQHLPYSVIVSYQLVLANGTRLNLSSNPYCSNELWVWVSSPVLHVSESTVINRILLYSLNYFMEWTPPHVTITTTVAPCHARMRDFLSEMTASVSLWDTCCCRNAWLQSVLYSVRDLHTIFALLDAAATIYFAMQFVWQLDEYAKSATVERWRMWSIG